MIRSREDFKFYLEKDRIALNKTRKYPFPFIGDEVWKFQRLMRKIEYIKNCKGNLYKPYFYFLMVRYRRLSIKLGFTIPINCFGYGLSIAHYGTIVINPKVKIGNYCRIHTSTNIGGTGDAVPKIGDRVYIGPGAKLFGNIEIADGIKIGANSVVNKSFLEPNVTIVGAPAKVIEKKSKQKAL
ncbi:serine acetyltransferase [Caldifermentibacillus hisashii]|uniref:serine O-acetyltransferase n=1 Tax=Caldifermentibacillus hisashii TaxID=996558 RepID=UPI0031FE1665